MSDGKKKRMSMLDTLAASSPPAPASMMSTNRALRSARDAVDSHRVWDLDPEQIIDDRPPDRFDNEDIQELRHSIEVNGQMVPILVRRDPADPDRFRLVYGARRLAAIRDSDSVRSVRALIANLDDQTALRAQVTENSSRRDLSFIERAVFCMQLTDNGFSQSDIAEIFNATRSSVSMAINIARTIGAPLAQSIGPAHGIGRPRWETLAADLERPGIDRGDLHRLARTVRYRPNPPENGPDPSVAAFEAVARAASRAVARAQRPEGTAPRSSRQVLIDGQKVGRLQRTPRGLRLELTPEDPAFADWLHSRMPDLIEDLHSRWKDSP